MMVSQSHVSCQWWARVWQLGPQGPGLGPAPFIIRVGIFSSLSGCWGLLDTGVPGYLVIGAGTRVGGVSCDAGGDVTREHRMHPSHVRSSLVSAVCVWLLAWIWVSLCLLLRVCRAALGTSTLHHVLITTECLLLPPGQAHTLCPVRIRNIAEPSQKINNLQHPLLKYLNNNAAFELFWIQLGICKTV